MSDSNVSKTDITEIEINGAKYLRADSVSPQAPQGPRIVLVIDRGWIYAGDATETNGRIRLTRAVWVMRWEGVGFDGLIADPKSSKVTLKPMSNIIDIPADAEVYRVLVGNNWGL